MASTPQHVTPVGGASGRLASWGVDDSDLLHALDDWPVFQRERLVALADVFPPTLRRDFLSVFVLGQLSDALDTYAEEHPEQGATLRTALDLQAEAMLGRWHGALPAAVRTAGPPAGAEPDARGCETIPSASHIGESVVPTARPLDERVNELREMMQWFVTQPPPVQRAVVSEASSDAPPAAAELMHQLVHPER